MNASSHESAVEALYEVRSVSLPGGANRDERFGYRLLKPQALKPSASKTRPSVAPPAGERYPLVLYLHGAGERGSDNAAQLRYLPTWMASPENLQRYPCFLVAPQCREKTYWVETPRAVDRNAPRESPGPMMQGVIDILADVLANFPVDECRLYLTGLSMGGYGSWDLGTRLAERWAAVAPICGGGDELYADRLAGVPVWAWHGADDDVVPVSKSRTMIEAIRQSGGNPQYTELPGIGHDSWTPAYSSADGLLPWLFAQRKDGEF